MRGMKKKPEAWGVGTVVGGNVHPGTVEKLDGTVQGAGDDAGWE
jgi:hypothetical protein